MFGRFPYLFRAFEVLSRSFFPLTVLTDVQPGMTAFEEEIFGPVIAIVEATS